MSFYSVCIHLLDLLQTLELVIFLQSLEANLGWVFEEVVPEVGLLVDHLLLELLFENLLLVDMLYGTGRRVGVAELYFVLIDKETIGLVRLLEVNRLAGDLDRVGFGVVARGIVTEGVFGGVMVGLNGFEGAVDLEKPGLIARQLLFQHVL